MGAGRAMAASNKRVDLVAAVRAAFAIADAVLAHGTDRLPAGVLEELGDEYGKEATNFALGVRLETRRQQDDDVAIAAKLAAKVAFPDFKRKSVRAVKETR